MSIDRRVFSTVAAFAAGLVLAGGAAAYAASEPGPSVPSSPGTKAGQPLGDQKNCAPRRGTVVTGEEATKVTDAVKAKDSAVTVEQVRKLDDGSYRVRGTKAGERVGAQVSSDLKTVTVHQAGQGGHGGRHGGPGGPEGRPGKGQGRHQHTVVTGEEATKVTDAVKAKDSAVTVEQVRKLDDGSYRVRGTKAGERVGVKVSSDLKTVTVHQAGQGRHGGPGQGGPGQGESSRPGR